MSSFAMDAVPELLPVVSVVSGAPVVIIGMTPSDVSKFLAKEGTWSAVVLASQMASAPVGMS